MTPQRADPYAVLGIPRHADDQQVRQAYRRLAKRYHPDLHPGAQTSELMRHVNDAWHVLSDPARRSAYDAGHPQGRAGTGRTTTTARTAPRGGPPPWGSSAWSTRPDVRSGPAADVTVAAGPPWLGIVAVLVVAWLALGGLVGGFPLPGVLAIFALVAARWVLGRVD